MGLDKEKIDEIDKESLKLKTTLFLTGYFELAWRNFPCLSMQ